MPDQAVVPNHLANYDPLTGLPNRALFHETLTKTLAVGSRRASAVAVLFIDLDHFKLVNDSRGHAAGDSLLLQFADRVTQTLRVRDTVGRLGGDEFAVILLVEDGESGAARVAEKLLDALSQPFEVDGAEILVSASIGIAVHPDDAGDGALLLRQADEAMYGAKQAGRNTFRFFTAEMNAHTQARLDLEAAVRAAVEQDEFVLHYQPKIELGTGEICGAEALLRWQRPGHGLVSPREFMAALEATGLIVRVGSWVVREACRQAAHWAGGGRRPLPVSINISRRQLVDGDLVSDVTAALQEHRLPPHLLEIELTENSLAVDAEQTIRMLRRLKDHGVRIAVDDFGTGYSSLSYLRRFPVDTLKLDVAAVRHITSDPADAALALTIIRMAHTLKLDVVAVGVETVPQLVYLRRHHCEQMQGYLFSPPLPPEELAALLESGARIAPVYASYRARNTVLAFGAEPRTADLQAALEGDGYRVLRAGSVGEGLDLMAMHDVQIIVCDQSANDAGARFLDLVQELYPVPLRMIVAEGGDVATATHAINRGPVHRYYNGDWDLGVLRGDVRDAFRQYWLAHDLLPRTGRAV